MRSSLPLLALLLAVTGCDRPTAIDSKTDDTGRPPQDDTNAGGDDTADTTEDSPEDTTPPDEPPVASATAPAEVWLGEAALFDGSASYDPQGYTLDRYAWTCTDGTTAEGSQVELTFTAEGEVSCSLEVTASSGLKGEADAATTVLGGAQWTFMVFLNGDNNLSSDAVGDVNEMEQVGSTADVNVVVQLDQSRDTVTRYLVQADSDTRNISSPELEDLGELDSGDPDTIIDFVRWAVEAYPARHYGLVMWDHGDGWAITGEAPLTKGFSDDYSSGNGISVANGEYETIVAAAADAIGRPLDLVGFDACLMQSWEVAQVTEPYADIYVGSQATEGNDGWAYDAFLAELVANPSMDAAALGEQIAVTFYESGDSTQSVVDLLALPTLDAALDVLATALIDSGASRSVLSAASRGSQSFGYDDHDLIDFLDNVIASSAATDAVKAAAEEAKAAAEAAILSNYVNGSWYRDAKGMSLYTPAYGRVDSAYYEGTWADETLWDDFLRAATE